MGLSKHVWQKPLTPAEQAYFLKLQFPGFRVLTARNELHCVGALQPTATSAVYKVELRYRPPSLRPRVRVLEPPLRLAPGRNKLPHVFDGNELCLHILEDWRPDQRIAEFIIPWISFWLVFYEFWTLTGEWLGGGHEPSTGAK
jgi:hypothetical protein